MLDWQVAFVDFLIETGALRFGEFKTKSGRLSPYFINTGLFNSGKSLARLGGFYAKAVREYFPAATLIYGPAYKGIPLCTATAMALWAEQRLEVGWAFNRKEAKGHGDGGLMVGRPLAPQERVVLVDDVLTDGLSKVEALKLLAANGNPKVEGLVIAVNREEQNAEGRDAVAELERAHGLPVKALLTLTALLEIAEAKQLVDTGLLGRIKAYRAKWGVRV